MGRLIVVARPSVVTGFHLAGVEGYPVTSLVEAQEVLTRFMDRNEQVLVAVDEVILARLDNHFRRRLEASSLLSLALPTGEPLPAEVSSQERIAEMIRQAIGFHITFEGRQGRR